MAEFAAEPNARVKISGIGLPNRPWTVADNAPVSAIDIAQLALAYKGSGLDVGPHPIYLREPDAAEPKPSKTVLNG